MRFICPKCGSIVVAEDSLAGGQVLCGQCSATVSVPPSPTAQGAVINDFVIEKEIGHGGMGTVYRAEQMSLERLVALKILLPKYAGDTEFVTQFIREARAAAKLNHPNIVQAYAVGEENGIFYFAMELIEGPGTMKTELQKKKIIPVQEAVSIVRDVADALHFAWREAKIVHHDIKPDNIMVTASGHAKLADLGLAKASGEKMDAGDDNSEVLGTPQYISPEQLTGEETDVRSDLYSLGATFYHFVTGRFPFTGDNPNDIAKKHLDEPLVPPAKINPDVPEAISKIICRMMEKAPAQRYQGADEVSRALNRYLEENTPLSETMALKRLRAHKLTIPQAKKLTVPNVTIKPNQAVSTQKDEAAPAEPAETSKKKPTLKRLLILFAVLLIAGSVIFYGKTKSNRQENQAAASPAPPQKETVPQRASPKTPAAAGAASPAAVAPKPPEVKDRPEFLEKVQQLEQLFQQGGSSDAFLTEGDAFFFGPLYPGITPNEKKEAERIFELYNRADERVRVAPARRRRARLAQEESDRRRQETNRRQEVERRREAREQEQKLARERKEQEKRQQEADWKKQNETQLRERESKYVQSVDDAVGKAVIAYVTMLRQADGQIFTKAAADAQNVVKVTFPHMSDAEKTKKDDATAFITSLSRTVTPALQTAVVFTGKQGIPYQFEVRSNELAKITGPGDEFGILLAKSMIRNCTLKLSLRDPDFRSRFTRLLSRRMPQVKNLTFYFDLADGAFSPAWLKTAPSGWWTENASRFAQEYLRVVYAKASEAERAALRRRYENLQEFKSVVR